ncbi:hypothetical protein ACKLNR_000201 [Fusarium oxysporum f. sp. zingiberi]
MNSYQPINPDDQESDEDNIFKEHLELFCGNMEYHTDNFKTACRDARDELLDKLRHKFKELRESLHYHINVEVRSTSPLTSIRKFGHSTDEQGDETSW